MINHESLQALSAAKLSENTVKPLYDSYCFSRIPGTVDHLLTGNATDPLPRSVLGNLPTTYDKIILLFIDAFGWRFFESCSDQYPFLKRFLTDGVVSKLTSQFPSTTAVHYTTIQTGMPVGAHGVFTMAYYEPLVDRMISPLYFGYPGGGSLRDSGIAPEQFFPTRTLHHRLAEQGVKSYLFQDRDPFSDAVSAGAHQTRPYRTLSEGLTNLTETVLSEPGKAYCFLYFGALDALSHIYGPGSKQLAAEIDTCFTALERVLWSALSKAKNTLLLVTADHGQTEISPETTFYLDHIAPEVMPMLRLNRAGERLPPGGSPRDMFLYLQPAALDDAYGLLADRLQGYAEVRYMRDMVEQGFFGGDISEAFRGRAADLVILPHDHESLWWTEGGSYKQPFYGFHGGLSLNEMEIPLLALAC